MQPSPDVLADKVAQMGRKCGGSGESSRLHDLNFASAWNDLRCAIALVSWRSTRFNRTISMSLRVAAATFCFDFFPEPGRTSRPAILAQNLA